MTAILGVSSDAELVILARAGDQDAFRELFDRHVHRVTAACRQKTRSRADVDDAVQEAFARALANLDRLRDPARFGPWVRSIAVRAVVDQHRASRRVIVIDDASHAEVADSAPLPDETAERRELDAALWASLARLGERDRTALYLRHIAEAPVSAVAEQLGLTEGSTRVMLVRARERLRFVASGLASLIPLSWRQWIRDHVNAATPTVEALTMVVAVSVAAVLAPPPVEAAPAPTRVESVGSPGRAHSERAAKRAEAAEGAATRSRRGPALGGGRAAEAVTTTARPRGASGSPPSSAEADQRRNPLRQVKDSVTFRREYPEESETDELLDVTVYSGPEENTVRLYGNQVNETVDPAAKTVDELTGGGE